VYAPQRGDHDAARLELTGKLRHAIGHDELVLHFQPKIDLRIGKTIGVEALVRWRHSKRGLMSGRDLLDVDLPATTKGLLDAWRIDPGKMDVDLTESSILAAPAIETLSRLGAPRASRRWRISSGCPSARSRSTGRSSPGCRAKRVSPSCARGGPGNPGGPADCRLRPSPGVLSLCPDPRGRPHDLDAAVRLGTREVKCNGSLRFCSSR
jgi:hypothetical protein